LLSLEWEHVRLDGDYPHLTVKSEYSKTGKTRYVPLNKTAREALQAWKQSQQVLPKWVFTNPETNKPYYDVRKPWDALRKMADLSKFRFHDQRHDCASKLAMKGVDLYTISKILGHSDVKMTQRYAHLAPKTLTEALAKLD
jgi:integrase